MNRRDLFRVLAGGVAAGAVAKALPAEAEPKTYGVSPSEEALRDIECLRDAAADQFPVLCVGGLHDGQFELAEGECMDVGHHGPRCQRIAEYYGFGFSDSPDGPFDQPSGRYMGKRAYVSLPTPKWRKITF